MSCCFFSTKCAIILYIIHREEYDDKKETILNVDDTEINRLLLHELFGSDYNIIEAENGVEVMDIIHRKGDKINLILLDIIMPKKLGMKLCKRCKE